jgi:glyoxylase-like metal-dependent hydrolase (beta-lactamase superfamily II)
MRNLLLATAAAALMAACGDPAPVEETAADPAPAPAAAPAAPAAPTRAITQVSGDLYRFQNNAHYGLYLVTPEGVIVADPINAETAEWLKGEIATRHNGAQVKQVLYSHHHWDHAGGAAAYAGAPVLAHADAVKNLAAAPAADAPLVAAQATADANKDGKLQATEATGATASNFAAWDKNADGGLTAREIWDGQYAGVKAPDQTYPGGVHKVTLGGKTVEMHHVGGIHASDLSFIYFPAEKAVFLVDVISLGRLPNIAPNYDEKDQFALIDKALAFDANHVVGGHGNVGADADVQAFRQYFTDLRQGVQAGIDAGQTVDQVKANLKLEKYAGWIQYNERIGPNIEGMYAILKK